MDDWQETALNHRRIPHGRSGKKGGKGGSFDVRRSLGVYELRGNVVDRISRSQNASCIIEIHGQTEDGQGLVGSVNIGNVLQGMLLLAGSRSRLKEIVREAEEEGSKSDAEEEERDESEALSNHEQKPESEEDVETTSENVDNLNSEELPSSQFEKNTFRSPKFWVQWRANVKQPGSDAVPQGATDRGYFVFSGNDCKSFQGTLTCADLGWKNVAITGHKIRSKPSDCPSLWTDVALQ